LKHVCNFSHEIQVLEKDGKLVDEEIDIGNAVENSDDWMVLCQARVQLEGKGVNLKYNSVDVDWSESYRSFTLEQVVSVFTHERKIECI